MDYEIDFLPVGDSNGDAICLRYGTRDSFWVHVVDGGFADTADTVVDHIREYYGQGVHINHMVLAHADNDHACGLVGVLKTLDVKNLWMNRPWLYALQIIDSFHGNWTLAGLIQEIKDKHPYLLEMEAIANSRGIAINSVFAGRRIGECFTVLAPSEQRYIQLLPNLGKTPQSYENKKGFIGTVVEAQIGLLGCCPDICRGVAHDRRARRRRDRARPCRARAPRRLALSCKLGAGRSFIARRSSRSHPAITCPPSIRTGFSLLVVVWCPTVRIAPTSIGAPPATSIASSKASSRPICRCRRRPSTNG